MSEPSKTVGFTTLFYDMRDPLSLLNAHLHEALLEVICHELGRSPEALPSMYLAKSRYVQGAKSDGRSFMLFDLHIKEDGVARDAVIITLELVAKPKDPESC